MEKIKMVNELNGCVDVIIKKFLENKKIKFNLEKLNNELVKGWCVEEKCYLKIILENKVENMEFNGLYGVNGLSWELVDILNNELLKINNIYKINNNNVSGFGDNGILNIRMDKKYSYKIYIGIKNYFKK